MKIHIEKPVSSDRPNGIEKGYDWDLGLVAFTDMSENKSVLNRKKALARYHRLKNSNANQDLNTKQ